MASDLAHFVQLFINKGYSAVEAAEMAHATVNAQPGRSHSQNRRPLARESEVVSFPASPEGGNVDYGEETPEQAKRRWEQQEREDPQGLFTGGASGGGVFGQGAIATSDYDPEAHNRTEERVARQMNLQTQQETLRMLGKMSQRFDAQALPPREEPRIGLPSFTRKLARRRR